MIMILMVYFVIQYNIRFGLIIETLNLKFNI